MKQTLRETNRNRRSRRVNISIVKIDSTLYQAKSQSGGEPHQIWWSRKTQRWECDCMGFVMRDHCAHADKVTIDTRKGRLNPKI